MLEIDKLCKAYPTFSLKNVSFSLDSGKIMGFIGKNGAGKTTTLKSLLNMVHPDSGTIRFFGKDFTENEREIKQDIGYAAGEIDYFPKQKIRTILKYTKPFFKSWDDEECKKHIEMFELDPNKKITELSCGMRVKFSLLLALSHHAKLLLLDEPTSGLDPVSRDDLLSVFLNLKDRGMSILFSTHITSDLDKCADEITYIHNGSIVWTGKTDGFTDSYRIITVPKEKLSDEIKGGFIGLTRKKDSFSGLITADKAELYSGFEITVPDLEEVMIHMERGNK